MPTEFTTSVGRLVWGDPTKPKAKTDNKTRLPVLRDGKPVMVTSFGVAFPKADFQANIWPHMAREASTLFPNGAPQGFAWKYVDGDTVDKQGKPYADREGYAGCYVLAFSTELPPPGIFKWNGSKYDQLPPEAIKCGDYVVCGVSLKANQPQDRTQSPSMYVNPTIVEFVGYGTLIVGVGAVDPMTALGGVARQLPPGASATPIGAPATAAGIPGMPQPGAPAGYPAPAPAPAPMAAPGGYPAPMAAPPPPPTPAGPQRPADPSHIAPNPAGGEFWWINGAWTLGVAATLPPPAPDFVANAGMPAPMAAPGAMPGMPQPGMMPQPGAMPGR